MADKRLRSDAPNETVQQRPILSGVNVVKDDEGRLVSAEPVSPHEGLAVDETRSSLSAARGDDSRQDRAMEDRAVTENRTLTDEQRLEMFRASSVQPVLPDLPVPAGYHVVWLTTTNPRDTPQMRERLGYTPIKSADLPGWEHSSIKTGDYAGCIGVNEMVAYKLPQRLYDAYMREAHHDAPLREQEKLTATVDAIAEQARRDKGAIEEDEGFQELRNPAPRAPTFS